LTLPITPDDRNTLIDPVPAGGGLINGSLRIGFDSAGRPVATYHKFDGSGCTQVYAARFRNGDWTPRQVTGWATRWDFQGGGSIVFEIELGALRTHGAGRLALPYRHVEYGKGLLVLEEDSLAPMGVDEEPEPYPPHLVKPRSSFPGMTVRWEEDIGGIGDPACRYVLRWETLRHNRDSRPEGPLPEPSMLSLLKLSRR
jgi:hypothetical protein